MVGNGSGMTSRALGSLASADQLLTNRRCSLGEQYAGSEREPRSSSTTPTSLPARRAIAAFVAQCLLVILIVLAGSASQVWSQSARNSSREAANVYAEAASYQNSGQYDLAAEQWERFIKAYPRDPKFRKAQYYAGVCRQQLGEFKEAVAHFTASLAHRDEFSLAEDAYLNLGWIQYSLGRQGDPRLYAKAEATLGRLIQDFPKSKYLDQALFYLGESRYEQDKFVPAVRAYSQLVDKHPKSKLFCDALYNLGVAQEELKQFAAAGSTYDLFLGRCRESELTSEVRMRKAETLLQTGQPADAERMFASVAALPDFGDADHALFRQADCLAKQERFLQAGRIYGQLPRRFPKSDYRMDATLAAGRSFYRADEFDQSVKWFEQCLELEAEIATEAAHWLCKIHLDAGRADRAVSIAGEVLRRGATGAYTVHLNMDQADGLYEQPASRKRAIAAYLNVVSGHPRHELAPQALYNAAFGTLELQEYDQALKHVAAFLVKYGKDRLAADAICVAAESHLRLQNYDEAATAFRRLVEGYPGHDQREKWQLRLGWAHYLDKDYATTAAGLSRVVGTLESPDNVAEAHFLVGVSQFRQEQYEPAQRSLSASLAAHRTWRQADETLLYLSRAQRKRNRLADACASVERLIADFAESSLLDQAYYRLGEYREAAADFAEARRSYQKLIDGWPKSVYVPYALHGLGWSQLKGQAFKAGAESFGKLIQDHPQHQLAREARLSRVVCLRQSEQAQQALAELNAYLESELTAQQTSAALYERGLCQAALDDYAAAVSSWQQLLRANDAFQHEAQVLYELGWAYKELGKSADAATTFARLTERHSKHPLSAEAHFHVGEDHYGNRRLEAAIRSYRQAIQGADGNGDLDEISEQAWHKSAWAYYGLGDYEVAARQFSGQLENFPEGALNADGRFMQAECLFKAKQHAQAWTLFAAVRHASLSSPRMQVLALLHGGQCAAQLERWQDSYKLLDQLIRQFPGSSQLSAALYERGWAQQHLGRLDAAVQDYERASTNSRGEVGARARFMIGEVEFERQRHAEAVNAFRRVMYGFGGEKAPAEVKQWQAVAGYEAGRCAEVQIKAAKTPEERMKAIAAVQTFFRFVVDKHAQHELAGKSRQRLAALARLAN